MLDMTRRVDPDPDGSVARSVAEGHTLPSSWYTDEAIFELEQRLIFRRAWEFVGHRGQVSKAGDFFTCEVGGIPIVVVCGRDMVVRAFLNICRHRHNTVAHGSGNQRLLHCGYHAWTYKLDGSLNRAPRSDEDPGFDGSKLGLKPVGVDFFGDMVFVNPSGDAPPLADVLGPIPARAREKGVPIDEAVFRESRSLEIEANWKIPWDNNCECYHCSTVHSSWYKEARLDPDHVYMFPIGPYHFQHVVDQRDDAPIDNNFFCWPTFTLATDASSGADFAERVSSRLDDHIGYFSWRWIPLSARRTRIEYHLFTIDVEDQSILDKWFDALLTVMLEDKAICEAVQASHNAGVGELGTLIPGIDSEFQTQVWERLIHRALTQPETELYAPLLVPRGPADPPHLGRGQRDWVVPNA